MSKDQLRFPYRTKSGEWNVNFDDRDSECGDVGYVVSEYLHDSLIYNYNRNGKAHHEHSFNALLSAIIHDCTCGYDVDISGFVNQYSTQELGIILRLISRLKTDTEQYKVKSTVDAIKEATKKPVFRIEFEECDNTTAYDSKVGGKIFWKEGMKYPSHNGIPMFCIAQINLKDLPENDIFAKEGMLQFFVTHDLEFNVCHVVYHEDLSGFADMSNIFPNKSEHVQIVRGSKMVFRKDEESISRYDSSFQEYLGRFDTALSPALGMIIDECFNSGLGSKLLGYAAIENRKGDALLFQLDIDPRFFRSQDFYTASFFLKNSDLGCGNFRSAKFSMIPFS